MSKPQGTFLHLKRADRVAHHARKASHLRVRSNAERVHRPSFGGVDLFDAARVAQRARDFGGELSSRGDSARRDLQELLLDINDLREVLSEFARLHAELRAPMQKYQAIVGPPADTTNRGITPKAATAMADAALLLIQVVLTIVFLRREEARRP